MSKYGLKIKNIKSATLFGYNQGIRDRYDFTNAMFSKSLFSKFIINNGLNVYKNESTRDIICLEFDFGSRSYEEEVKHIEKMLSNASEESKENLMIILENVHKNKDRYVKMSKEEIREHFYQYDVDVEYLLKDKEGTIKKRECITYKMLYRTPAKAKTGQVMFINKKLFNKAYNWMTMGIGNKMSLDNAKIVEMSAYAPLVTSTIIDELHIPIEDILILQDQDSFFRTMTKTVKAEEYNKKIRVLDEEKTELNKQKAILEGSLLEDGSPKYKRAYKKIDHVTKKCVVVDLETEVKNTVWDGMGLIDDEICPSYMNGMLLLRNHFFKMCGFRCNMQLFFQDWCYQTGNDYLTYEITDMFGRKHKLKDIKVITTDNAIKWKKFSEFMGKDPYAYWCERINMDGSIFGVVKTDHKSKLGEFQQMSYQMINTLPSNKEEIHELAKTSIEYVELIKSDNNEFEKFLRNNINVANNYEMLADMYNYNNEIENSNWFRNEKVRIIKNYVDRLRKGKIFINADNLTVCGNPYALLLYSVGEDWEKDPTLNYEKGSIQCYTTRFEDGEFLCAIRNPHNSPNNICYFHNHYSPEMQRYFQFSNNILAINCINSDVQDRANGMDEDSDFMFTTNHEVMVNAAKNSYINFPTIVNKLEESGITYQNTPLSYAQMDNKFAKSRVGIGESSNLAQLAMTYYWTFKTNELYENFIILSVLAQVIIDGCKREYEVDGIEEIERIKRLPCMQMIFDCNGKKVKKDLPLFMKYTKEISGVNSTDTKEKLNNRINYDLICPMNWIQESIGKIQRIQYTMNIPIENYFIKNTSRSDTVIFNKVMSYIIDYDNFFKFNYLLNENNQMAFLELSQYIEDFIFNLKKVKTKNSVILNRLIEVAFGIEKNLPNFKKGSFKKYCSTILKLTYMMDKDKFLSNFQKSGKNSVAE